MENPLDKNKKMDNEIEATAKGALLVAIESWLLEHGFVKFHLPKGYSPGTPDNRLPESGSFVWVLFVQGACAEQVPPLVRVATLAV